MDEERLAGIERFIADLQNQNGAEDEDLQPLYNRQRDHHVFVPPSFTGYSRQAADSWLDRFNKYVALEGYNDDEKLATFRLLLTGSAEVWYQSLLDAVKDDLDALIIAFTAKYVDPPALGFSRESALMNTTQKEKQSVEQFLFDIKKRAAQINKTDDQIKFLFMRGLKKDIRQHVLLQAPDTLDQAESMAILFESTMALDSKPTDHANVLTETNKNVMSQLFSELSTNIKQVSNDMQGLKQAVLRQGSPQPQTFRNNYQHRQGHSPVPHMGISSLPTQSNTYGQYTSPRSFEGRPPPYCFNCKNNTHSTRNCNRVSSDVRSDSFGSAPRRFGQASNRPGTTDARFGDSNNSRFGTANTSQFRERVCFNCNQPGHIRPACPYPTQSNTFQSKNGPSLFSRARPR